MHDGTMHDGTRIFTQDEIERSDEIIVGLGDAFATLAPAGVWLSRCPFAGCDGVPVIAVGYEVPGAYSLYEAEPTRGPNGLPVLRWHLCRPIMSAIVGEVRRLRQAREGVTE